MAWHTGLSQALRARNIPVWDGGDWQTRTAGGTYTPIGVMVHHTASSGPLSVVRAWFKNRFGKPLAHMVIRKSGQVDMVAGGLVYGSGSGSATVLQEVRDDIPPSDTARARGLQDSTSGNRWFVNIEVDYAGDHSPIPKAQQESVIATCVELCRLNDWPWQRVIAHKEWTRRKVDPNWPHPTMDEIRAAVRRELETPPLSDDEIETVRNEIIPWWNSRS